MVQGIIDTVGIEMALGHDIVIAADTARFQQLESRRGIAPLGLRATKTTALVSTPT